MKTVKAILFNVELDGRGIVNYDGDEQKWSHPKIKQKNLNNLQLAKKNFYRNSTDENALTYKIKISSDCLKHAIFGEDFVAQSPNIVHNKEVLYSYISSPTAILKGYLFAKDITYKKSSPISITDAEQTNDAESSIEFFARSGQKTSYNDPNVKDNTIFNSETIGDIQYAAFGRIDIHGLQFISCDQIFDRFSFNPDNFELYKQFAKLRFPEFNSELAYYSLKNTCVEIPEYGILLQKENVMFLVKQFLTKLLNTSINRRKSFARVKSLKIKFVYDGTKDLLENSDGWIEIKSQSDINSINFEPNFVYELANTELAVDLRQEIVDAAGDDAEKRSKKKEEKSSRKSKNTNKSKSGK